MVAKEHAEALVRLGFLKRAEYSIEAQELAALDELLTQLEGMKVHCPWWTYSIPKGATKVVVIGCPKGMARWQQRLEGLPLCTGECCPKGNVFAVHTLPEPAEAELF